MLLEEIEANRAEFDALLQGAKNEIITQWISATATDRREQLWAQYQGITYLRGYIDNAIAKLSRGASDGDDATE